MNDKIGCERGGDVYEKAEMVRQQGRMKYTPYGERKL